MEADEEVPPELQGLQEQVALAAQLANTLRGFFPYDGVGVGGAGPGGMLNRQFVPERAQAQAPLVSAAGCGGTGTGGAGVGGAISNEENRGDPEEDMEMLKKENRRLEKKLKKQHARITDLEQQLKTSEGLRGQLEMEKQLSLSEEVKDRYVTEESSRLQRNFEELKKKFITASKGPVPVSGAAGGEGEYGPLPITEMDDHDYGKVAVGAGDDPVNNPGGEAGVSTSTAEKVSKPKGPPESSTKPGSQRRQNEGNAKAKAPPGNLPDAAQKFPPNPVPIPSANLKLLKFPNALPPMAVVAMHRCGTCGVRFLNEGDLRAHLNSHRHNMGTVFRMGAKYKCEKCAKSFTAQTDLIMHNVLFHRFQTSNTKKS